MVYDDTHVRVSAMLRRMMGDVSNNFDADLEELYKDDDGILSDSGKSCWKWHIKLRRISADPYTLRKYASLIQYCFDNHIDLDKFPPWRRMMRIVLPEEYNAKIKGLNMAVVQVADMDVTTFDKKKDMTRSSSDVLW